MKSILFIDFTSTLPVAGFSRNGKSFFLKGKTRDGVLLLAKVLKKARVRPEGIIAVRGPGGFSCVRGSVLAANMLAALWRIPVAGILKKEGEDEKTLFARAVAAPLRGAKGKITPFYNMPPNITVPKAVCSREFNLK